MKYLVRFNESRGGFHTDLDKIRWVLLNRCKFSNLRGEPIIHPDGTVDVDGDVKLNFLDSRLPIKFGYVSGNLTFDTPTLTSLEGCPKFVGNDFSCQVTRITNLIGGPEEVGQNCHYSNNPNLTSAEGAPKKVHQLWFHACRNLWNIQDVRDISFGHPRVPLDLALTTVSRLQDIFGPHNLIHSLDYRYFREIPDWWFPTTSKNPFSPSDPTTNPLGGLNLFRFKEALDEFEVRVEFSDQEMTYIRTSLTGTEVRYSDTLDRVGRYVFLDDSGNMVNFNGDRI